MKIGVISDTHLNHVSQSFIDLIRNRFLDCQMVIHSGDFTSMDVYYHLYEMFSDNLIAVYGNMDPPELRKIIPNKDIFIANGVKIGVVHGWGSPNDLEDRISKLFKGEDVNCIVYGHSHNGKINNIHDIILFNSGSPTDTYYAIDNTIGYIKIVGEKINCEIVKITALQKQ